MPDHPNYLLARLSPTTFEAVTSILSPVRFVLGDVLAETHQALTKVYFPHSGIISCVVETIGGGAIEIGMIGRDGQFGGGTALDHQASLNHATIQIEGEGSVAKMDVIRKLADEYPEFRMTILGYEQFFLAQVQQTAACNAIHDVQARTCKWLLRMHQLIGVDLNLTQSFLAQMMGVRRTNVSTVAGELQSAGMISYSRGRIRIIDIDKVRRWACECDDAINSHYDFIFPTADARRK